LHAPLEPHAETSVLPPAPDIRDDESTHSDHGSYLSSEYDSKMMSMLMMSMQMMSHNRCPSGHKPPYRQAGDLVGDPTDQRRTRSQFEDPPHALTTTETSDSHALLHGSSFIPTDLCRGCRESLLGSHYAGGVQLSPREPDLGSGSSSFRQEACQMQMGLQDQEGNRWTGEKVQGKIGFQRFSADPWDRL
jgi:hypothetical protein